MRNLYLFVVLIILNGCATIINATDPNIDFASNVDSAIFYGEEYCFTPCELDVERTDSATLSVFMQNKQYEIVVNAKRYVIIRGDGSEELLPVDPITLLFDILIGALMGKSTDEIVTIFMYPDSIFLHYENGQLKLYDEENKAIDGKVYEIQ